MKTCTKCGAEKPRSEFHKHVRKPDGLAHRCKACSHKQRVANYDPKKRRAAHLVYEFGITHEQWEAMRAAQRDACASCREPFKTTPHTDHNHTTGAVRGLLCSSCNLTLGNAKESASRLLGLVDYLARH